MKRLFFPAAVIALVAPLALAQTTTWTPDPAHSEVDFAIRHMSLTTVHGRFGKVTGTIQLDQADPAKSSVHITIDVNGVDTGIAPRDNDLRSAKYFNVAQYPTATFVSTSVQKTGSGLTVTGNLTLHGVTRPVTLNVDAPSGPITGMDHKPHMGYSASATLNRDDFGIGTQIPNSVVGQDVKLTIELDAVRQ